MVGIGVLLGLIFRGVAFEFRWRTERGKTFWDWSFALGSIIAAFAQGITLGALAQGIHIEARAYAGGWFDRLTSFSLLTGLALTIGYALLGATWLLMKTEGFVHDQARGYAWIAGIAILGLIALVSIVTPFFASHLSRSWVCMADLDFQRHSAWPFCWALPIYCSMVCGKVTM